MLINNIKVYIFIMIGLSFSFISNAEIWVNPDNTGIEDGFAKATGYNTLWEGIPVMSPGDTIVIANGNWVEYQNMYMDNYHCPPSGGPDAYSRIIAETDWGVRLPYIYVGVKRSYIEIRGIVFDSRVNPKGHAVFDWHHTKFIRCGFLAGKLSGNVHTCGFGTGDSSRSSNHHNLMEECIAWGCGRYIFECKYGQYNIFRRCVARHDASTGYGQTEQIANFRAYACDYTFYQNCISIDSDRPENYDYPLNSEASGFWVGDQYGATGNQIHGCISIKDVQMSYYISGGGGAGEISIIKDSIALDATVPGYTTLSAFILKSLTNLNASNILGFGALYGAGQDGYYGKKAGAFNINNSILKDVSEIGVYGCSNTFINHYNAGSGSWGAGHTTYDPEENGLLYPVRIEEGSALYTAGEGGSICGPTILKKIGVSGTLYGEPGWDEVTDEKLWPFPNEDKIKELMSETVEGVPGIYGFTAYVSPFGSPNTLTTYIWEYLGNKIPPEIYGGTPSSNKPPVASASANPNSGHPPLMVRFTSSGSDSDGSIISYSWDFGDGNTANIQNPTHTYAQGGFYTVKLTVMDDDNATASSQVKISISPGKPAHVEN